MKELKYIAKATKKAKGESYAMKKGKVNSYYGMACTRIYSTLKMMNGKKQKKALTLKKKEKKPFFCHNF